jgi:exodeoxyribonuclease III
LEKKGKPVIIVGDLNTAHENIDIFNPERRDNPAGFTKEERGSFTKLLDSGFVDTFRKLNPTLQKFSFYSFRKAARTKNRGWRLDYVLASQSIAEQVIQADVHSEIMGSDHCPISVEMKI